MKKNYLKTFTLLELLVVIAIIGVLVTLLVPSLSKAREVSRRAVCLANMKQLHTALIMYEDTNDGLIPLGYTTSYQLNYLYKDDSKLINQGLLSEYTGQDPGILYCPSQTHNQHNYDTNANKWNAVKVRTSFSSAPLVDYDVFENPVNAVRSSELDATYTLFADIVSSAKRKTHWNQGFNTVKVGGQGKWVHTDAVLDAYLDDLTGSFSSSNNNIFENMWIYLSEK